eukprot:scaffold52537_cov58-Phaeocystis_antarctica.AAC.1
MAQLREQRHLLEEVVLVVLREAVAHVQALDGDVVAPPRPRPHLAKGAGAEARDELDLALGDGPLVLRHVVRSQRVEALARVAGRRLSLGDGMQ